MKFFLPLKLAVYRWTAPCIHNVPISQPTQPGDTTDPLAQQHTLGNDAGSDAFDEHHRHFSRLGYGKRAMGDMSWSGSFSRGVDSANRSIRSCSLKSSPWGHTRTHIAVDNAYILWQRIATE